MDALYEKQAAAIQSAIRDKRLDLLNSSGCIDFYESLLRRAGAERERYWRECYDRLKLDNTALNTRVRDLRAVIRQLCESAKIELTAEQLVGKMRAAETAAKKETARAREAIKRLEKAKAEAGAA